MIRFPSKTFLLGEYAVLQGSPALLLGHPPFFAAESTSGEGNPFHPESPAGKWLASHPAREKIIFRDPLGRGGFGGSGAEFLTAWSHGRPLPAREDKTALLSFAWKAWEDSRAFPGSGADILTQAWGLNTDAPFLLAVDLPNRTMEEIPLRLGGTLSLFHTGKKVNTREETGRAPTLPLEKMKKLVREGIQAALAGNLLGFASAVQTYGEWMGELGLLAAHSRDALENLDRKDVWAAKGCGAMGADVMAVLHQGKNLDSWARENSLAPVIDLSL